MTFVTFVQNSQGGQGVRNLGSVETLTLTLTLTLNLNLTLIGVILMETYRSNGAYHSTDVE